MLSPLKLRDFRLAFPAQPACQGQNPCPPEQRERKSLLKGLHHPGASRHRHQGG